jgi:predicted nucleotidyltransferase
MQGILAATVLRPDHEWYLSDLAAHLEVGPSSLQRSLAGLTQAGILRRREDGNRVYYHPDPDCPIFDELAGMLAKTAGIAEPLREALEPFAPRIRVAFIHGSIAEGRERSESDIDLMVVGDVPNADLTYALRSLHDRLGREVNVTRYTAREFRAKVDSGHHFLTAVLKKPRIFLIGGEHELDQVAGRPTGGERADQQK